jgi:hypothetical protein
VDDMDWRTVGVRSGCLETADLLNLAAYRASSTDSDMPQGGEAGSQLLTRELMSSKAACSPHRIRNAER